MYLPYGYGMFEPTYLLVIIGAIISLFAQFRVQSTYARFSRMMTRRGATGAQVAHELLVRNEMGGVNLNRVSGNLTDHFDPRDLSVNLSEAVYGSSSIAAVAVASHECGHVMQHRDNYFPYNFRHTLVPVANFGSSISWVLIIAGLFLGSFGQNLITIGILMFSFAVLFQLVTLPVELNASRRALAMLSASGAYSPEELMAAKKVLSAAALTYVAGAATAILSMLRLILLFGGRRRD